MRIRIVKNNNTIRAAAPPCYKRAAHIPNIFSKQSYHTQMIPLSHRDNMVILQYCDLYECWNFYHSCNKVDESVITKTLEKIDEMIPFNRRCKYYGLMIENEIEWIGVNDGGNYKPNPNYRNKIDLREKVITIKDCDGTDIESDYDHYQDVIVQYKSCFTIINSTRFDDFFFDRFFSSSPWEMNYHFPRKFRKHIKMYQERVKNKDYQWIRMFYHSNKLDKHMVDEMFDRSTRIVNAFNRQEIDAKLDGFIYQIKVAFVSELLDVFRANGKKDCRFPDSYSKLLRRLKDVTLYRGGLDMETVLEVFSVKLGAYHKWNVLEYLKNRTQILSSIQYCSDESPFHVYDPYLNIAQFILAD